MIHFEQVGGNTPKDIKVTTDDSDGELAAMEGAFVDADWEDAQAAQNLKGTELVERELSFIVPGDEAGEVAEVFEAGGVPQMQEYLDELNAKAIADAGGS